MVDQAQHKIQESMRNLVDDLDKSFLRGMQRAMHLCSASCCERNDQSVDQVHNCIERCSAPLTQAQSFIEKELGQFQERLQRCVMVCQDKVREKVTANTSESQENPQGSSFAIVNGAGKYLRESALGIGGVSVYKAEFEACAMICVEDHIQLMPSTKKRIAEVLEKKS